MPLILINNVEEAGDRLQRFSLQASLDIATALERTSLAAAADIEGGDSAPILIDLVSEDLR